MSTHVLNPFAGLNLSAEEIDAAVSNMSAAEVDAAYSLQTDIERDGIIEAIRQPVIRKAQIGGQWVDTAGPMLFLRQFTRTIDFHAAAQGTSSKKPFPYRPHPDRNERRQDTDPAGCDQWDYLDWCMYYLLESFRTQTPLYIPKSREVMTSWLAVGYAFVQAQFSVNAIQIVGQSEKDDKAQGLIKYANTLYENQPDWMKDRFPLKRGDTGTKHSITWASGSEFIAVPQGVRQTASTHPTVYLSDESAHQPEWAATVDIVRPVAKQIVCISSAAFSDFGRVTDTESITFAKGQDEQPTAKAGSAAVNVTSPHPGIATWSIAGNARVLRLHYTADPEKSAGEKTYVPELKESLSPWALGQYEGMADKALFRQEYNVDFAATQGQLVFTFKENEPFIVCKPFIIPAHWTRYYILDPHPRVPHAHLWAAVDPYGDRWLYREFWPSKIYGQPGNIPEDDNRYTIREHMEVIKYLESADNPENPRMEGGGGERIYRRVIDYAARAFGQGTSDDEPEENFQVRFERIMRELKIARPFFQDATKDRDAGIIRVNEGFKPVPMERKGKMVKVSRIHIFSTLPETILELRTARYPKLTALQADTQDPIGKPILKRIHFCDLTRYLEMANPRYVDVINTPESDWKPLYEGTSY